MTNRIPEFPNFKHLGLEDQSEIDQYTRRYPPYSDFNFVSLFVHDIIGDCQISRLNSNLIVRFRDDITLEPFYSFLGNTQVADTATRLLLADKQEPTASLRLIPETCISSAWDDLKEVFTISEDPDSADYIIDASSLVALSSGSWRSKRKAANKFRRSNPNHTIAQLDLADAKTCEKIKCLFYIWAEKRGKTAKETQNEFKAIDRLHSCPKQPFENGIRKPPVIVYDG